MPAAGPSRSSFGNVTMRFCAVATRYDKLAITYRAAVTISAILTWLRHMGDTP